MYDLIDHTADVGIRVSGSSLAELFVNAADAFFDITISTKKHGTYSIDVPIACEADSLESLFVKWLQELVYVYETRRLILSSFWIDEIDERHLVGSAKGMKFDSSRHSQKLEVKAVTYHQLDVSKDEKGRWSAKVIFDI